MNLYEKLLDVRKSIPYLQKDTKGYNYDYVSGSTVLGRIKEKMDEHGLLLIPLIISYETKTMPTKEKGVVSEKPTVICKMIMRWLNVEKPEEKLDIPFACFGTQDDISKAFGSALTYSERYFLLKFFNIPTSKDDPDEFQDRSAKSKGKPEVIQPTEKDVVKKGTDGAITQQINKIQILAQKIYGKDVNKNLKDKVVELYKKTSIRDLTIDEANDLINKLKEDNVKTS